jgi:hypothetical protein
MSDIVAILFESVSPMLAAAWLAGAVVLAVLLLYGWQRLLRR